MEEWEIENTTKWTSKQLHGEYKRQVQVPEITSLEIAYRWKQESTGLKIVTEALITTAQDQAPDTKCHKAKILHTTNNPKCSMCKDKDEAVAHIVSACPNIAGSLYKTRHNNVVAATHHSICQHYEIKTTDNIWLHKPNSVAENSKVKVLWDFEIRTERQIQARRPDLVVVDKQTKEGLIIDVAIPNDTHIVDKESEKIEKYQDLRLEIQRMWNIKARVVSTVGLIEALGATSNNLEKHLQDIPGKNKIPNWHLPQLAPTNTRVE